MFGGYCVALIANAAQVWARATAKRSYNSAEDELHVDPLHISSTFLTAVTHKKPYQLYVTALKRGRTVTHVEVKFCQPVSRCNQTDSTSVSPNRYSPSLSISAQSPKTGQFTPVIISHILLNSFASRRGPDPQIAGPSLVPPEPQFIQCPLTPMESPWVQYRPWFKGKKFSFRRKVEVYEDLKFNGEVRRTPGQGAMFGCWFTLATEGEEDGLAKGDEGYGYQWLPLAADLIYSASILLNKDEQGGAMWYPTMSQSVEFKRKVPPNTLLRRWGQVCRSRFLQSGQYESDAEIWSHPADNHLFDPPMKEEDGPQIIAIARQLAITVELSRQLGRGDAKAKAKAKGKDTPAGKDSKL